MSNTTRAFGSGISVRIVVANGPRTVIAAKLKPVHGRITVAHDPQGNCVLTHSISLGFVGRIINGLILIEQRLSGWTRHFSFESTRR